MKLFKFKFIKKNNEQGYFLFALVEFVLIIAGILTALFIDNWNAEKAYHNQIDNNVIRVYDELKGNISACRENILELKKKDSLIYRVMADSVTTSDYQNNLDLAYLIMSYHNTNIEEKAYQNLVELNRSENLYQEELITSLKDIYELYEDIERDNNTMHDFVYDKSIPLIMKNSSSFAELTYHQIINDNIIDFFMTSDTYKSHVSIYSILAIRNQLRLNQLYYKKAISVCLEISEHYELDKGEENPSDFNRYTGKYVETTSNVIYEIAVEQNELYLVIDENYKLKLIHLENNQFFIDHDTGGFFVTFHKDSPKNKSAMTINLLANRKSFEKQ